MEILEKIPVESLPILKDIYKIDYPLHVATQSTIQVFIDRIKKTPNWDNQVQLLSFGNVWKTNGAFIMVQENRVFFNTLEEFPFKILRRMLLNLELDDKVVFINIRDNLRSVIFDTIRINHYEVVSDIGSKSFLMPKEVLQTITVNVHEGFELKPVGKEHAKKINAAWTGKFANSEKFIEQLIEFHPSMGFYDKTGELLAWNIRLDSGSMGIGSVDTNFGGNRYGHTAILGLAVKIAKEFDTDIHFEIVNENHQAQKSAKDGSLHLIDTQSWVSAKRKKKCAKYPMWGHL